MCRFTTYKMAELTNYNKIKRQKIGALYRLFIQQYILLNEII